MRMRAILLCMLVWAIRAHADIATDPRELERQLSVLFATEPRTMFCDTGFVIRGASAAGSWAIEAGSPVAWSDIVPGLRLDDLHNWALLDQEFIARRDRSPFITELTRGEPLCGGQLAAGEGYLPAPASRGDVARLLFYLESAHGIPLAIGREKLLAWDLSDPVDAHEAARAWRIDLVQGTRFGTPRRSIEEHAERSRRLPPDWKTWGFAQAERQLANGDYFGGYYPLVSSLEGVIERVARQIIDGKPGAWDRAFEVLSLHDLATSTSRPRAGRNFQSFPAKMFALAVASGNEAMARRYAQWLIRFQPPGARDYDLTYPAWVLQMAEVVNQGRWPRQQELRSELGPYRELFVPHADLRAWREAVGVAANAYLESDFYEGAAPRLLPVEFTALTSLRRKYQVPTFSGAVHALQNMPTSQVPAYRESSADRQLRSLRKSLAKAALPALHRAILADDESGFRAALNPRSVNETDHTGATPLTLAAEWHRAAMVRMLVAAGGKLSPHGAALLLNAAETGQRETLELLLAAGANPSGEAGTMDDRPPLAVALRSARDVLPMVDALLSAGARPGQGGWRRLLTHLPQDSRPEELGALLERFRKAGMDPAHVGLVCSLMLREHFDVGSFELARALGASLDEGADQGEAPIFCAIDSGNLDDVRWLVEGGAKLDVRDAEGRSPSRYARGEGFDLIGEYLRQADSRSR